MTQKNNWQTLQDEVRKLYEFFDRKITECIDGYMHAGGLIHCGKGCRSCCNLTVNCTFAEAMGVAAALTEEQAGRVKAHAARLLEHIGEVSDLKSYLRMQRRIIGFCPLLLDDGACGVYGARPFSCRSLLSTKESHWCGADFGELSAAEKTAFIDSLDRSAVSFPMHYLATTRDLGQQLEARAAIGMAARFGFSLSGNLPFLIYLEREHHLSKVIPQGCRVTMNVLEQSGLFHSFLTMLDEA